MYGFNSVSIDSKGRVALPARYRASLLSNNESSIIITRDPQYPSLKVYFGSEWEDLSDQLKSLQSLDPIVRKLQWTILGNASVNEFDPSGRMLVLIPSELREYAEINNNNGTKKYISIPRNPIEGIIDIKNRNEKLEFEEEKSSTTR